MEELQAFRILMDSQGHLEDAGRRGNFDCAEFGVSMGQGALVSILFLFIAES